MVLDCVGATKRLQGFGEPNVDRRSRIRNPFWRYVFPALKLTISTRLMAVLLGARLVTHRDFAGLSPDTWIVDVRSKPDFRLFRLKGAGSYPKGKGLRKQARKTAKDRPMLLVCPRGHASALTAITARRVGFKHVYILDWGMVFLKQTAYFTGPQDEVPVCFQTLQGGSVMQAGAAMPASRSA